jgi:SAM-dependent methyltransferase
MFLKIAKETLKGKTIVRALMNLELSKYTLSGKVLDIGGGDNPSYFRFFKDGDFNLINIDSRKGDNRIEINLEKDKLPYDDNSANQVLILNVLEHIYNHKFVVGEIKRVLKNDGQIIGFVPFLVCVHPDPHDYFRYTGESLQKIFKEAGFNNIKIKEVGLGPFTAGFNTMAFIFPKFLRLFALPFYYFLDKLVLIVRPKFNKKFPLGYLFILRK